MSGERLMAAAGIEADGALGAALEGRAAILEMTDRSRETVLRPAEPGGLSHALRAALAARVARLSGETALAERYAADLARLDPDPADAALAEPETRPEGDARLAAMVAHLDMVATRPRAARAADVARLTAAGVAEADIVRLSQLVAFLAYEARVVAGLRLMGAT